MLGREGEQCSFFDAGFAVEGLLEPGTFYDALHRLGPRLVRDDDFVDCYDVTTGRPSVPPSRMFKLLLLQGYEGLSDRQAIERMAFDLRWKAALGLEVHDRAVAQSTLVEFRARVQLHGTMEQAFGRLTQGLMEAGIISAHEVQVVDSTAIWGRGAVEDTYNLIGSAVRKLLGVSAKRRGRTAEELAVELGLVVTAPADEGSLKGRADIDWEDEGQRRAFLNRLVAEARLMLSAVSDDELADADVAEAAGVLRRILLQDLEPVREESDDEDRQGSDDAGAQAVLSLDTEVDIRQGVAKDRVVSAGDPEMRRGHKSRSQSWDGYKAHVSVEAGQGFITAVEVTPANVHDAAAAPELIERQKEQGLSPVAEVGDMAYSAADLRQWASEQGTEIVARVPPARGVHGCFGKDDFEIDLDEESVRCPAGHTTRHFSKGSGGRRIFVFDGAVCAACRLRERCTRKDPDAMRDTGRGRSISWHPLEPVLQAARKAEQTERVQDLLARRWIVEQCIARLVRRGLRQARYKGTHKVRFQAVTAALVTNLVRLIGLSVPTNPLEPHWSPA
jgi:transposase/IS5 family transposase